MRSVSASRKRRRCSPSRRSVTSMSVPMKRQATRVYLKQITEGKTEMQLGNEEAEAIRQALSGGEKS